MKYCSYLPTRKSIDKESGSYLRVCVLWSRHLVLFLCTVVAVTCRGSESFAINSTLHIPNYHTRSGRVSLTQTSDSADLTMPAGWGQSTFRSEASPQV